MTDDFSTNFVKLEPAHCIKLCSPPTEEVIRLDKEGFHYRGQFIADAGEAHRLMVEFLRQQTQPEPQEPTDEEITEWADAATEIPQEALDPEVFGWRRCFGEKEFADTIRAALARWAQ